MTPKFQTWATTVMLVFSSEMGNTEKKKLAKGVMFDYEIDLEHNECEMSLKYPH